MCKQNASTFEKVFNNRNDTRGWKINQSNVAYIMDMPRSKLTSWLLGIEAYFEFTIRLVPPGFYHFRTNKHWKLIIFYHYVTVEKVLAQWYEYRNLWNWDDSAQNILLPFLFSGMILNLISKQCKVTATQKTHRGLQIKEKCNAWVHLNLYKRPKGKLLAPLIW